MKKIAYLVLSALVFSLVSCHSRGAAAAPSALPSGKETSEIIRQETPIKTSEEEKKDGRIHVGIQNVRRRIADMCGGSLQVESTPGVGTTVTIVLPRNP